MSFPIHELSPPADTTPQPPLQPSAVENPGAGGRDWTEGKLRSGHTVCESSTADAHNAHCPLEDTTLLDGSPVSTDSAGYVKLSDSAETEFDGFPFETPADDDDVVELELFNPEDAEQLPDGPSSRGSVAGTVAAVVLHVWLLATLHQIAVYEELVPGIQPIVVEVDKPVKEKKKVEKKKPEYTLVKPNDRDLPVQKVLNAISIGVVHTDDPKPLSPPDPNFEEINPELKRREVFDIPEGVQVSDTVVVQGTTGNSLIQLESALDRVTHEIAMHLKERKVLVVWLLDASTSLQKQRDVIAQRMHRIYGELDALKDAGQIPHKDKPLLTGVVSFGQSMNYLTPHPTADFDTIVQAVESVPVDESGRENVFTAVSKTVHRWGKYRFERQIMLITVTDESGDDFAMMEPAIALCRARGVKGYVIGPSAAFGRRKGYVPYVAPENNKTYQIPVDIGPETARYENVLLPFWFEGPQYKYLSSGYGPYALSRLVRETGGIYFTTNMVTMKGLTPVGEYKTEQIKPFEPNYSYGTPAEYDAELKKHPLRYAVAYAAQLSRQNKAEGTPALELRVTPQNYRQRATQAQEQVARSQLMIDTILQAFPRGIEKHLEKERSARWRMNFCLTYGRLLAHRVRNLEYNAACADLKSNLTPQDVGSSANHWIFRPDDSINYATSERRNAKTARRLLQHVIDEAPGTPWAALAKRELKHPFGLRVVKRYIPPPTPRQQANNNNRRRIQLARERKKRARQKPKPKPVKPKLPRY